ncbi:MAG: hypothetical protein RLY66_189 [Candidatus Parcubacteria bacterium]|jgi:hypothetical protein
MGCLALLLALSFLGCDSGTRSVPGGYVAIKKSGAVLMSGEYYHLTDNPHLVRISVNVPLQVTVTNSYNHPSWSSTLVGITVYTTENFVEQEKILMNTGYVEDLLYKKMKQENWMMVRRVEPYGQSPRFILEQGNVPPSINLSQLTSN